MKLPPFFPIPAVALQRPAAGECPPAPPHCGAAEPDWRCAYRRLREQDPAPPLAALGLDPMPAWTPRPSPDAETAPPGRPAIATPTVERIASLRQLGEAGPTARVWQVELPSTGPAWQLRIEQAQPLAPLTLELRVPPAAQGEARQRLGDLDRRLREAGHDTLRPRLRTSRLRGPLDGVGP